MICSCFTCCFAYCFTALLPPYSSFLTALLELHPPYVGSSSAWIVPPRAVFRACARGRAQVGRSLRQRFAVRANAKEEAQVAGRDSKAELVGHCVEWRYEDYNQWCPYDAISSDVLERAYACGNTSVSLSLQTSSKIALRGVALYAGA